VKPFFPIFAVAAALLILLFVVSIPVRIGRQIQRTTIISIDAVAKQQGYLRVGD
jgi:hypothetical protein